MKDFMNYFSAKHALGNGTAIPAATTTNGDSIDVTALNGGNDGLVFVVDVGTITDGSHLLSLQDSIDGGSTWNAVTGNYVQTPSGQVNTVTSATPAKTILKFGYLGNANVGTLANSTTPTANGKVLVRIIDTCTGGSTGGYITAIAILGYPQNEPAV